MITIKVQCDCGQKYAFDVEPVNGRMNTAVACPACGADGTAAANEIIARRMSPMNLGATPMPSSGAMSMPPEPMVLAPIGAPAIAVALPPVDVAVAQPSTAPVAAPTISLPSARLRVNMPSAPSAASPAATADAPAPPTPTASRQRMTKLPGQIDAEQAAREAHAKVLWGDPPQEVVKYLMIHGYSAADAQSMVQETYRERIRTVRSNGIRNTFLGFGLVCVPVATLLYMLHIGVIQTTLLGLSVMAGLYGFWLMINGLVNAIAPKMEKGDANA